MRYCAIRALRGASMSQKAQEVTMSSKRARKRKTKRKGKANHGKRPSS